MQELKAPRQKATRIVGLDFGLARIGIAISDETKMLASPHLTLKTEKKLEKTVEKLIKDLQEDQEKNNYLIEEVVVGLPLLMSGKTGFLADEVKHFVEMLKNHLSIPIVLWDERLTSVQAERSLRESSLTRKKRSKLVDSVAALIILQNYLDFKIRREF